jgi:hypothetical protein
MWLHTQAAHTPNSLVRSISRGKSRRQGPPQPRARSAAPETVPDAGGKGNLAAASTGARSGARARGGHGSGSRQSRPGRSGGDALRTALSALPQSHVSRRRVANPARVARPLCPLAPPAPPRHPSAMSWKAPSVLCRGQRDSARAPAGSVCAALPRRNNGGWDVVGSGSRARTAAQIIPGAASRAPRGLRNAAGRPRPEKLSARRLLVP